MRGEIEGGGWGGGGTGGGAGGERDTGLCHHVCDNFLTSFSIV